MAVLPAKCVLPNEHYMPSGIPAGSELSAPMRQALIHHAGVPLALQPVIEDGTEDEIKACIFRVLSYRVCEVMLDDMAAEFNEHGIKCMIERRREWGYLQPVQCVTVAQLHLMADPQRVDLRDFMAHMAAKYGFRYNRMSMNHKTCTMLDTMHVMLDPSVEVDAEIMWPHWT